MELESDVVVDQGEPAAEAERNPTNPITDLKPEETQEEVKEEKPKEPAELPKGVQRRIDRAVRAKYEAEARTKMLEERLAALETRSAPPQQRQVDNSEPTLDKFENFDEYVAAKAEWIAERKINETLTARERAQMAAQQERAQREMAGTWQDRITKATAEMPDFEDVLASSDVPMTDAMQQAIMESEVGPRLAYYLASNPEEARQLAVMSPIGQIRALGRIEAKLEQKSPVTVTKAPPPVKPVGQKAAVTKDPGKMSDEEYAKWRRSGKAA